jgi:hypothetical protein
VDIGLGGEEAITQERAAKPLSSRRTFLGEGLAARKSRAIWQIEGSGRTVLPLRAPRLRSLKLRVQKAIDGWLRPAHMAASDASDGVIPTGAKAKTFHEKLFRNEALDGRFQRSYLGFRQRNGPSGRSKPSESFFKKFSKKAVDGR